MTTVLGEVQATAETPARSPASAERAIGQIALVDLLDRLLGTGVVLAGDVVISLAGVDLVQVRLHALITTIRAEMVDPW
jgi:hypothetical protein